jgi:hypothetical protein
MAVLPSRSVNTNVTSTKVPKSFLTASVPTNEESQVQGLTLAHFRAQLEHYRDTSLTLELNFSTFGTHPRVRLGHVGDNVSWS